MGPCKCPEASKGIKGAWNIAKALGYKKQDTKLLLHPTKAQIGNALKELKNNAIEAEKQEEIKAQAFLIINFGNTITPESRSHKELL